MGKDLITLVTALRQWGDRWVFGAGNEPVLVLDRRTGRPIPRQRIVDEAGTPIDGRALEVVPGPGATGRTRARYQRLTVGEPAVLREPKRSRRRSAAPFSGTAPGGSSRARRTRV
jgi:hypothetical protein